MSNIKLGKAFLILIMISFIFGFIASIVTIVAVSIDNNILKDIFSEELIMSYPGFSLSFLTDDNKLHEQLLLQTSLETLTVILMCSPLIVFGHKKLDSILKQGKVFNAGDEKFLKKSAIVSAAVWFILTYIPPWFYDSFNIEVMDDTAKIIENDILFEIQVNLVPLFALFVIYIFMTIVFTEGYRLEKESSEII